jgi:hypothetical protein
MALTLEFFEIFKEDIQNVELVNQSKFGVYLVDGDSITELEISEEDFEKYKLTEKKEIENSKFGYLFVQKV